MRARKHARKPSPAMARSNYRRTHHTDGTHTRERRQLCERYVRTQGMGAGRGGIHPDERRGLCARRAPNVRWDSTLNTYRQTSGKKIPRMNMITEQLSALASTLGSPACWTTTTVCWPRREGEREVESAG